MLIAQFEQGRRVGKIGHPLFPVDRQQPQPPRLHMLFPLGGLGDRLHVAPQQGRDRRASAVEGDVGPFDLFLDRQSLHDQMLRRPGPGRGVADLSRVGLGVVDELLEGLPGRIRLHDQPVQIDRVLHDRGEILGRVVGDLAHVLAQDRAAGQNADRIPVGLLGLQQGHGDRGAAPGLVHHHDRLPQDLARRRSPAAGRRYPSSPPRDSR